MANPGLTEEHFVIGISLRGTIGIGDRVICSSFPENFFCNTQEKVIDVDQSWVFDHNPYIVRGVTPSRVINLWQLPNTYPGVSVFSVARRMSHHLGLKATPLRHPRLYVFEDLAPKIDRITLHVQGSDKVRRTLPPHVLDLIADRYRDREIIQVGGPDDSSTNFEDARGLPIWDTVKLIATSSIFIGVDSGLQHIASAYPRVAKRIFLTKYTRTQLENEVIPMASSEGDYHWLDVGCQFFNCYDEDIGVTYSYSKV